MKLAYVLFGATLSTTFESVDPEGQTYLINYGFKQSMADSHANSLAKVEKEWKKRAEDAGVEFDPDDLSFAEAVRVQSIADAEKRLAKINDGTMAIRDGDPLRALAVELIRKRAAKEKKTLPDGKSDAWRDLVAATLEKNRAALQKEMDRRAKADITIEL